MRLSFVLVQILLLLGALSGCQGISSWSAVPPMPSEKLSAPTPAAFNFPARDSAFLEVTRDYGPLRVQEGEFEVVSERKPWSSWWYPVRNAYLFQGQGGELSPLEKFDLYSVKARGRKTHAAYYERDNLYDPVAVAWEGLCHAWSIASLMEPEPTRPLVLKGVSFGVGDLKALLVKTYEEVDGLKRYGQRYDGDRLSQYDDIYPDQFHRFVQAELFEERRSFIMDKDPGVAIWNTPIWKAFLKITHDPDDLKVMHVTTWLTGASPFVDRYDFVGTLPVSFEYTYDLWGDPQADGTLAVRYGEWTGTSRDYHPDFVTPMPDSALPHRSKNVELDLAGVNEILQRNF